MSCDKNGKKIETMNEKFDIWDAGEFTYSNTESELKHLPEGVKLNTADILGGATKCPVHNGTCQDYFTITIHGYHPEKGCRDEKIMMCPIGVTDIDHCPLSK